MLLKRPNKNVHGSGYLFCISDMVIGYIQAVNSDGTVLGVWIDPHFRNKKFGEKMMRELQDEFGYLRLFVEPDNKPALRLYEKVGFVPTGNNTRWGDPILEWRK